MAYEHKIDKGSIFLNSNRETESHPDYTGSAKIACPHCNMPFDAWLSGWVNQRPGKDPYVSMSIQAKDEQTAKGPVTPPTALPGAPVASRPAAPAPADLDDDIPF